MNTTRRGFAAGLLCYALFQPMVGFAEERLDVVAPWEINSIDPVQAGHIFGRMQVAETLLDTDLKGNLVPGLATQWSAADDGLSWQFTLREGVHFHDNSEMTVEAVAQSLNRTLNNPGVLSQAEIESIEAVDGGVRISLAAPYSALPALMTHYSTQILAPAAYGEDGKVQELIATGPFRIVSLQTPQRLEAERFDDYWGEAPEIPAVSYLAAPRGETRALMAQSGDADIAFTLDAASQARLRMTPSVELFAEPIPRTVTVKLNAAREGFDSVEERRALSLAINRQGIARGVMRVEDAATDQLMPAGLGAWHLDGLGQPEQDLEEARNLLASQGWAPGEDGILQLDGKPFSVTLTTFADRPELPVIATALQEQWSQLGVDVSVNVGNSSEIPSSHQDGSLDMGLLARNFGLVPDPLATIRQDFGPEGGDWGAMNWNSSELEGIVSELVNATDESRKASLAHDAAEILHDQLPVIAVASYVQTAAVNARLNGFAIDPFERSYRLSELSWEAE
ncbi:ABC transporter substrate-binding protein [Halomonas huangheensis]|uniref:Solute-binding protein family 5 domain-containing protein n=1 Tax=Halomonas huangheensis TaxID=1178482 RepID=W1NBQ2_9GAMM|nr:ABC transporter substrate-binding protein [Halomonas huangheensis]ALM52588.1 ABC transporter substrate-binding protein [Halomonas huangheensis]ERL52903.1 hypothetical protein BJB45_16620 [Halomonas huangheensis]